MNYFNSSLKQLQKSKRWGVAIIQVGVVYMSIHISRNLKEELAWPTDKQLQAISNILLVKTVMPLKNKAVQSLK